MILSRELGKRIWGGSTNTENGGGGVSSDYIAGLLAGYATETWVDEHYISIDFFSRLFQAHGTENGSEIDVMPNDLETTITSVESMFGFWTNLYISALGSNGAAPAGISLGMLTDVTISGTPSAGQVLTFDAVSGKWVNGNATGASSLSTLTDVTLTSLQSGQTLLYDSTTSKWYNSALKTINGQSLLGSGDISVGGGASGNYLPLSGGTLTNTLPSSSGLLNITGTGTYSAPNDWWYSLFCMTSGMQTYKRNCIAVGQSFNPRNCGIMNYRYIGNGSTNNYLSFGLHSVDDPFCIYGNGNIGIGTSTTLPSSRLHVNGGSGDGKPILYLQATSRENAFNYAMTAINRYLGTNDYNGIVFGKALSNTNSAVLGYHHVGDGSSSNCLELSLYGQEPAINIFAGGNVGIGTGTPTNKLHVFGSEGIYLQDLPTSSGALNVSSTNCEGTFNYSIFAMCSAQPSGRRNAIALGKAFSQHNCAVITYYHAGDGSTGNFIGFGLHSVDDVLTVCANGNVGVKTSSPSYALHVAGTIYATGAITALSDARKKDITGEAGVTVEQIAHAPAVQFLWKDKERRKDGQQVGTLAQYWQTVLPEVVSDKGGELSMQYGAAALVSAIIIARKVVDHERRITELEKENERLKKEVEQLRLN